MVQALETVRHEEVFVATETDVLSDTDLRQIPGPGAVAIWAACDVIDARITVRIGNRQGVSNITVTMRGTGAPIDENTQAPVMMMAVKGGENVRIDVAETTAMNLRLVVVWAGIQ
ncbi:hypothetical protein LCGC14_2336530 [marine sediment metagenome]|uniref:Uncharacterized protein n=1 Tax=marine sediment metagenome TaxID=412755 RepID=A0A0F9CE69_9ZZZZ